MKNKKYLALTAALLSFTLLSACGNQAPRDTPSQKITVLPETASAEDGGTVVDANPVPADTGEPPASGDSMDVNIGFIEPLKQNIKDKKAPANTADYIGEEKAKQIAFEHAKVQESDTSFVKVKLDYDDGAAEYEVEFYAANQEYDYDIDAISGTIRSFDYEIEDYPVANNSSAANTGNAAISEEDAKALALAKVAGASESDIRIKPDYDDGKAIYEGKIIYDEIEYEFEIDAATGNFLEWNAESVYD